MIEIDQSAIDFLDKILKDGEYVKISVLGGGCAGLSTKIETTENVGDNVVIGKVLVDKKSLLFLNNAVLVYKTTPFSGILSVVVKNATSTCGCGESFSL